MWVELWENEDIKWLVKLLCLWYEIGFKLGFDCMFLNIIMILLVDFCKIKDN